MAAFRLDRGTRASMLRWRLRLRTRESWGDSSSRPGSPPLKEIVQLTSCGTAGRPSDADRFDIPGASRPTALLLRWRSPEVCPALRYWDLDPSYESIWIG